ncbi:LLM class flavin-dependent oxidoreductase [Staphylococcus sp. HKU1]|uniref:LLM class flavin-dependent oxidoreductase n=1 Tax=Staphylococcus sp. HKU1 TaxID=3068989 RepID=UPI003AADFE7C
MKLSVLDYVPIFEGRNTTEALNHSIELAQWAEQLGYHRYWVAEHHQVLSVASSAPEMIMMSLLENTSTIRIGSGGIMLPHYSAYKVSEQLKIMEARHPNRVDIGTGKSSSFRNVNEALNEHKDKSEVNYSTQIDDLLAYFNNDTSEHNRFKGLLATPQIATQPQMFILGMSTRSAKLAAEKGLPLVVMQMGQQQRALNSVIETYRSHFKQLHSDKQPYVMLATFVVTAKNEKVLNDLLRAFHLWLLRINYLNQPTSYYSIQYANERKFSEREQAKIYKNKSRVIAGSPEEVKEALNGLYAKYNIDEVMVMPHVYGEENRKSLLELIAL